jgi:hypothetical protein
MDEMDALRLLDWGVRLLARGARHPRHIAAILTAIAIPVITLVLLTDSGVSSAVGTVAMLSAVVLGIAIGTLSEHLGSGPGRWRDWSVVIVGALLGFIAVLGFIIFLGIFGSLLGLYTAAVVLAAWLALRMAVAVVRVVTARRGRPA